MRKTYIACAMTIVGLATHSQAAVYDIEVLTANELAQNAFAQGIDDAGNPLVTIQNPFNQQIDLSLLNFDDEAFTQTLTDPDAAEAGNFNETDYRLIIASLRLSSNSNFGTAQRFAIFTSYFQNGVQAEPIAGFDSFSADFNALSQAAGAIVRDSLDSDYFVGTGEGGFFRLEYTDTNDNDLTFIINDFRERAFVQVNGSVVGLPGPFEGLDGASNAYAINQNFQIAGDSVVDVSEVAASNIELCDTEEGRGDQPIEVCQWRLHYPFTSGGSSILTAGGQTRATIWQIAADGTLVSTTTYGLVFEPEDDDIGLYTSRARAINDAGVAVGESNTGELVLITRPGSGFALREPGLVATVFENGTVTEMLDRNQFGQSQAFAINNNGWVAGFTAQEISGVFRDKLFVKNLNSDEERIIEGFFSSSEITPRAINSSNIVVGEADVESNNDAVREKNAFMYNIDTDEFVNLNTLVECDSPYTLIDAVDINDNNEIVVTARTRAGQKNVLGNNLLDEAGEPVLIDEAVAIKLSPIANGVVDNCEDSDDINAPLERQGAAFSTVLLSGLVVLIALRRRFNRGIYS